MMIQHFSEMTCHDLHACLALRSQVFVVEQACIYQDIDGKDTEAYHLLFKDDQGLVACLRILQPGQSYAEASIGRVAVAKRGRGLGYGGLIMKSAMTFARDTLNYTRLKISAQAYLEAFYSGLGFKRVSEDYLEDDILHLDMLYDLASL